MESSLTENFVARATESQIRNDGRPFGGSCAEIQFSNFLRPLPNMSANERVPIELRRGRAAIRFRLVCFFALCC
jgi:hypothetical protein